MSTAAEPVAVGVAVRIGRAVVIAGVVCVAFALTVAGVDSLDRETALAPYRRGL